MFVLILFSLLLLAAPAAAEEYLLLGGSFATQAEAKEACALLRTRSVPAQFVTFSDYSGLTPGRYGVAFGAFGSLDEALAESARVRGRDLPCEVVKAGTYIGVTKSGRARPEADRWIIEAGNFRDRAEAEKALRLFHVQGLFPLLVPGRDYDNLDRDTFYLALDQADSERAGDDLIREVYAEQKELAVRRTGFFTGHGKDALADLSATGNQPGRLERSIAFRKTYAAAEAARARGDLAAARDAYRRCLALFPEHDPSRLASAKIDIALERFADALADLEELRKSNPTPEADYLYYLCRIKTDRENARPLFREFRALYPNSPFLATLEQQLP